jgi:hypothetical protein
MQHVSHCLAPPKHTSSPAFASHKHEPLGISLSRGDQMPEGLGTHKAFGLPLHVREQERLNSTKNIIFPPETPAAAEAATDTASLYRRTHGSFEPGESRGAATKECGRRASG